jgi:hypothetical protein
MNEYKLYASKTEISNTYPYLDPTLAPGLTVCAKRADNFCYWIAYEILNTSLQRREKLVSHILLVCHYLLKYQNLNSLMSIYLGI